MGLTYLEGTPIKNMVTQLLEVEVLFKDMNSLQKSICNDCTSTMKKELVSSGIDIKKHLQGGMVSFSRCILKGQVTLVHS